MAVSYYDWEEKFNLPDQLVEIPLDPFAQAIELLLSEHCSDSDEVVVLGYSRGAELALLLGTLFSEITGIVAYAPSALIWRGFPVSKPTPKSSWCYRGQPVPFAYFAGGYFDNNGWQDQTIIAQATIPVEKIAGPILLVSGADDEVWPSEKMAEMVMTRLKTHAHPYQSRHLRLTGVGHGIGVPNLKKGRATSSEDNGAVRLAWQAVREFLIEKVEEE
ncbi:dienelactone hydrolase family protein [Chloroflexi bacterium TSY]|nr:dienelactone hydrolase family protein [Chloroflexi bacterium TSY]